LSLALEDDLCCAGAFAGSRRSTITKDAAPAQAAAAAAASSQRTRGNGAGSASSVCSGATGHAQQQQQQQQQRDYVREQREAKELQQRYVSPA
jgi:hypothetical protein